MHGDVLGKLDKVVALGRKIGFTVHFYQHPDAPAPVDIRMDHSLGGFSTRAFQGLGKALLTQEIDSLLHISAGFLKSLLAVHHAGVGLVPQIFDRCS